MNLLIRVALLWAFAAVAVLILFAMGSELVLLRSRAFLIGVVLPLVLLLAWAVRKAAEEQRRK